MSQGIAEFAYDLHAGLSSLRVPEFNEIQTVGMAATLAIHIKGLGEIEYEVLRKVSDHLLNIPSYALDNAINILREIDFVKTIGLGRRIDKIIPNIPVFEDVYASINGFAEVQCHFNSHEEATLSILSALFDAPQNRDSLQQSSGIDSNLFNRCLKIGRSSGIISVHRARGRDMLISPYYFADNLHSLADAAAAVGATTMQSAIEKIRTNQGWPLSILSQHNEIGGQKLNFTESELIRKLAHDGVIKPPTIKFGDHSESFLFTPRPGLTRLNAANREIYERAMALISAVRKGQLLASQYAIRYPLRILEALRDRGFLGSNTEAREQYQNLVVLRVGYLQSTRSGWQLHLNRTEENEDALNLAIELLQSGSLAGMEVNQDARIALTRDETYIQSLISATELRKRDRQITDEQAIEEYDQLLLAFN